MLITSPLTFNLVMLELGNTQNRRRNSCFCFSANAKQETAAAKNAALRAAGANVPDSFDDLGKMIEAVYTGLVERGVIVPQGKDNTPALLYRLILLYDPLSADR